MVMTMLSFKDIEKLSSERAEARKLCPNCGHSILLGRKDRKICSHCGNYVFKDEITEFHYRMREKILKKKRESN